MSTFDSLSLNDDESESGILESESDEGSETSADRYFVIGSQSQSDTLDEDYQDSMCPSSVMSSSESTIEDVDDLASLTQMLRNALSVSVVRHESGRPARHNASNVDYTRYFETHDSDDNSSAIHDDEYGPVVDHYFMIESEQDLSDSTDEYVDSGYASSTSSDSGESSPAIPTYESVHHISDLV